MPIDGWITRIDRRAGRFWVARVIDGSLAPQWVADVGEWRGGLGLFTVGVEVYFQVQQAALDHGADDRRPVATAKDVSPRQRAAAVVRCFDGGSVLCIGPGIKALAATRVLNALPRRLVEGDRVHIVGGQNWQRPGQCHVLDIRLDDGGAPPVDAPLPAAPRRSTGRAGETVQGTVLWWNNGKSFGIAEVGGRGTYLLRARDLISAAVPNRGDTVQFEPHPREEAPGRPAARRIKIIQRSTVTPAVIDERPPRSSLALSNDASREPLRGTITMWREERGLGTVFVAQDRLTLMFVRDAVRAGSPPPEEGRAVEFSLARHPSQPGRSIAVDLVVSADPEPRRARAEEIGASSCRGPTHAVNEDCFLVSQLPRRDGWLLAVADGASNPVDTGWWASATTLEIVWSESQADQPSLPVLGRERDPEWQSRMASFVNSIQQRYLARRASESKHFRNACCTLAVAVLSNEGWAYAAAVGDSRVLIEAPGNENFHDIGWLGQRATPVEVDGKLASAIGYPTVELRSASLRLPPERVLALATDGVHLSRTHSGVGLYRGIQNCPSLQTAADSSVLDSVRNGRDDATLLLYRWRKD